MSPVATGRGEVMVSEETRKVVGLRGGRWLELMMYKKTSPSHHPHYHHCYNEGCCHASFMLRIYLPCCLYVKDLWAMLIRHCIKIVLVIVIGFAGVCARMDAYHFFGGSPRGKLSHVYYKII